MPLKAINTTLLTLIALLAAPFAHAHTGGHAAAGLADGFMHPVTGIDHVLIAVAAGFWASRAGNHGMQDVLYFLCMLLGGMLLGAVCVKYAHMDIATLLAFILTGSLIAFAIVVPQAFGYVLFGGFAIYHGILHVLGMSATTTVAGYVSGLILATWLLMALGLILRQVFMTLRAHEIRPR